MDQQQMKCLKFRKENDRYLISRECTKFAEVRTTVDHLYPDVWYQVFEYFNAMELFISLVHITRAADQVLFDKNHRFLLRGLVVDVFVQTLPEKFPLTQLVSLELHQESCLDIIDQCSELRLLKLIGQPEWTIHLLEKVSHNNMKLEQLTLVVPGIGSLRDILVSIAPIFSLRRLEIHANQLEEKIKTDAWFPAKTSIERFILDSCSPIGWDELSYMLSGLPHVRSLYITLFYYNRRSFFSCIFPNLRYIRLTLLEVSFEWIIHLVTTAPALRTLKLNGLVDGEGFVINHKWINLFQSCSSLVVVIVDVSLENSTYSFCDEIIQISLREINLDLRSIDDDCDYYLSGINQQRWWKLSGMVIRHHIHV